MKANVADLENKSILLVDLDPHSCEARARAFRDRGVMVDCAQDATVARTRYEAGVYNLVLLDLGADVVGAQQLAAAIKAQNPRQKIAFLLGAPPYVTLAPGSRTVRRQPVPPPPVEPATPSSDFGRRIRQAEGQKPTP
jgi:CheY-like chemotaxis protein